MKKETTRHFNTGWICDCLTINRYINNCIECGRSKFNCVGRSADIPVDKDGNVMQKLSTMTVDN